MRKEEPKLPIVQWIKGNFRMQNLFKDDEFWNLSRDIAYLSRLDVIIIQWLDLVFGFIIFSIKQANLKYRQIQRIRFCNTIEVSIYITVYLSDPISNWQNRTREIQMPVWLDQKRKKFTLGEKLRKKVAKKESVPTNEEGVCG